MGDFAVDILNGLFKQSQDGFMKPLNDLNGLFTGSNDIFKLFIFADVIYGKVKIIAIALLILIAVWQSFKVQFSFLGFECDEPWRIAGRFIVFGLLCWYAKDISIIILDKFVIFTDFYGSQQEKRLPRIDIK